MRICTIAIMAASLLTLSACGGGGGSGGSTPPPAFTQYSDVRVPGTVRLTGSSQELAYTYDTVAQRITSLSTPTAPAAGATLDESFPNLGNTMDSASIRSATGTTASANYPAQGPDWWGGQSADGRTAIFTPKVAPPGGSRWNYQTFAVWLTGFGSSSGTAGAFAGGTATAGGSIPTSGTSVLYSGLAMTQYATNGYGAAYIQAPVTATVNFTTGTITFDTYSSIRTDLVAAPVPILDTTYNLRGTLSFSAGTNQATGTVNTPNLSSNPLYLSGTVTGKLYGPGAEEMAFTYSLTNGVGGVMVGAFNGKR